MCLSNRLRNDCRASGRLEFPNRSHRLIIRMARRGRFIGERLNKNRHDKESMQWQFAVPFKYNPAGFVKLMNMKKVFFTAVAVVSALFTKVNAAGITHSTAMDLSGEWFVRGKNISGKVHLPGTLADAGLGERQTKKHFDQYKERTSKTALARKYKYYGKATYSRKVMLTKEEVAMPLELPWSV